MTDQLDAEKNTGIPNQVTSSNQVTSTINTNDSAIVIKVSQRKVDEEKYQIQNGKAVVINNIEFDKRLGLPDRNGSDVDASSLFQRFQELDFDSDLINDATVQNIGEKIQEIKEDKEELEKTDCLVFVFLTHGGEDYLYATDGELKINALMDNFNAENCPELALKPKIFIFQACRGSAVGSGLNARVIRDDPNVADSKADSTEYDKNYGETIRIPNEADFLAIYSSSSGYGSFRNTEFGSPFVRILSEELLKMEKGEDFYKVLNRVNRKVGIGYKPKYNMPCGSVVTQMPCFISHLTKDLILKA